MPSGRELLVGIKQPGDEFGELSALDGRPRSASAAAIDQTVVAEVPLRPAASSTPARRSTTPLGGGLSEPQCPAPAGERSPRRPQFEQRGRTHRQDARRTGVADDAPQRWVDGVRGTDHPVRPRRLDRHDPRVDGAGVGRVSSGRARGRHVAAASSCWTRVAGAISCRRSDPDATMTGWRRRGSTTSSSANSCNSSRTDPTPTSDRCALPVGWPALRRAGRRPGASGRVADGPDRPAGSFAALLFHPRREQRGADPLRGRTVA